MLELKNISLSCSKEKKIKNLDFEILPGENVVIPNWSSNYDVFFLAVLGMKKILQAGSIFFEGKNIFLMSRDVLLRYRRKIGYVPLHKGLLKDLTVQENILLSMQIQGNYNEQQIFERFEELRIFFLKGIDCESSVVSLSSDEEKRVMLARAVAASPKLLMLNCPIMDLELESKDDIAYLINEGIFCRKLLPKDSAVIISTEKSSWKKAECDGSFREFPLTAFLEE